MNLDEYINRMSWKKIVLIIVGVFLAVSLLRAVLVMTVFNHTVNSVNEAISHQKISMDNIHNQFQKADQETRQMTEDTFATVEKTIANANDHMKNIHDSMEQK